MLIIGLTGGIGSGKSTVATLFKTLGAPVVDADLIAHTLCEPGATAYQAIVAHFGCSILTENNQLDRHALRHIIFNNAQERHWLESLLHPLIRQTMHAQAHSYQAPYCLFVIPLLTESLCFDNIDRILVVDTEESLQLARASQRDHTSEIEIRKIMATQNTREKRLSYADDIIRNDATIESLEQQVKTLDAQYKALHNTLSNH